MGGGITMKVKELIEALNKMPEDYDVRICSTDTSYYEQVANPTMGLLENIKVIDIHEGCNFKEVIITNGRYYHK